MNPRNSQELLEYDDFDCAPPDDMHKHEDCIEVLCGCMLKEHKGYAPCPDRCQWLEDNK